MTFEQFEKIVPLTLTLFVILLERLGKIRKTNELQRKMYDDVLKSYKNQNEYLQEQLDACLDASRPKRPDA